MRRTCMAVAMTIALMAPSFSVSAAASTMTIGTNLLRTEWGRASDHFKSGVNWATETNPWNPQFLAELAPYNGAIRFMDWNQAYTNPEVNWSDRKAKTANQTTGPVAWEWMIDLCNRTHRDIWVNLPQRATDDYSYQLAQLIKAQLQADLRVYVEWTNETWNDPPYPSALCEAQGVALNLPGAGTEQKGYSYHVYAAVRVFEQFERVFGKDSPRLVKVLAGNAYSSFVVRQHMLALDDTVKVNPNKTKANAYATAPYMDGASAAAMRSTIYNAWGSCSAHRSIIASHKLKLCLYECGHGTMSALQAAAVDPAVYTVYTKYFDSLSLKVDDVACHFLHVGPGWGALDHTGQSKAEAHKYRAIVDWIAAHPPAPVSVTSGPRLAAGVPAGGAMSTGVFDLLGRAWSPLLGSAGRPTAAVYVLDHRGVRLAAHDREGAGPPRD